MGEVTSKTNHEKNPLKSCFWAFSQVAEKFGDSRLSSEPPMKFRELGFKSWISHETLCPKLKNLRIWPFKLATRLWLIPLTKWVLKTPKKHVFHIKSTWKTLKNMGDTKRFQKQIKWSKTFWFDPHMVEHTHITFDHVLTHKWNRHSLNN